MKTKKPFGLWPSAISIADISAAKRFLDVKLDGDYVVYGEGRGATSAVVVQTGDDAPFDVSGDLNVRGGVGYAGGEFDVRDGLVVFSASDGRLYRTEIENGSPKPITPAHGKVAAPRISPDGKWVAYVHTDGHRDVIAVVDSTGTHWPTIVGHGRDFYMQPDWSPDGRTLVWVSWDHPNMPWDFSVIEERGFDPETGRAAGNYEIHFAENASMQPTFNPSGTRLAFLTDATGRWQLEARDLETDAGFETDVPGEIGGPAWIQGLRYYEWKNDDEIVFIATENGVSTAFTANVATGELEPLETGEHTYVSQISAAGDEVAFIGTASTITPRVIVGQRIAARSTSERIADDQYSTMESKSWETEHGTIFGNYYPPSNPSFEADGPPPAIIMIHGGPSSQRTSGFDPRNQFFATRGYAVMDVNYRGSSGFGRDYLRALYGNWGIADVQDAVSAAKFLADDGLADPDKIVIMGGSAGGYTVLQALTDYPGVFKAGICLYGISNLFSLALSTHKFEASYNDVLLGPLPDAADIFRERSPIFKADNISDAVAIYHGAEDKVVPLDQAEAIVGSLRRRGVPHEFHVYENEGHGWRRPENIQHFYETLQQFLLERVVFA